MSLPRESVILKPDASYPLHVLAKRYKIQREANHCSVSLTVIVLHATGFHKETWEPTLEVLQRHFDSSKNGTMSLDIWCIECPNHGQSAVLNEEALKSPEFSENFSCEKYAVAVHRFLRKHSEYFCNRPLVGMGHSLGGVATIFLQQFLDSEPHSLPPLSFVHCILIEPMLSPDGAHHLAELRSRLVRVAYERRDVWPSRKAAKRGLSETPSTKAWHPAVTELYVKYALRTHPAARFTSVPYHGVTLCMAREQEAGMYRDPDGATKPIPILNDLCNQIPVHLILGSVKDTIPGFVHDQLTSPSSPRKFASITNLDNVGHLVTQQSPDKLGEVLFSILTRVVKSLLQPESRSKL